MKHMYTNRMAANLGLSNDVGVARVIVRVPSYYHGSLGLRPCSGLGIEARLFLSMVNRQLCVNS
jgi:hypothetical protein